MTTQPSHSPADEALQTQLTREEFTDSYLSGYSYDAAKFTTLNGPDETKSFLEWALVLRNCPARPRNF